MKENTKRKSLLGVIALSCCLLLCVALGCFVLFASMSVSGTASLPNGVDATITGPFSCSNNTTTTTIEAGGHVFAFSSTTNSVDNKPIAPLDSKVTDVEIEASYWTASLRINGSNVSIAR